MRTLQIGIFLGASEISQANRDEVMEIMTILNGFLEKSKFIAGDHLTIADFSIVANVSSFVVTNI